MLGIQQGKELTHYAGYRNLKSGIQSVRRIRHDNWACKSLAYIQFLSLISMHKFYMPGTKSLRQTTPTAENGHVLNPFVASARQPLKLLP